MAFPHYLTRTASGRFVFRIRVPADLRAAVGRDFIKRPLGANLLTARLTALELSGRYAAVFDELRGGMEKKISVADVVASVARNGAKRYEIDLPGGGRLRANDAADHARAMEALEAIGRMDYAPRAAVVEPAAPPVAEAITLTKASEAWLKSMEATTRPKTLTIKKTAVTALVDYLGAGRQAHTITRPDMARFYQHLRDGGAATPTVFNKQSYLGGAGGFFDWAIASGHYPAGDNPAKGHIRYTTKEKRQRKKLGFKAFDLEQVRQLYAPENFARLSPGAKWAALLGLYTGARASEVGQLLTVDVAEVDGVPSMRFCDEGDDQHVKTDKSNRVVPIHPDLLSLGFLEYVDSLRGRGDWRVFPQASATAKNGAGNWISKAFGYYLGNLSGEWKPAKRGFHSLRKTVIQVMQGAGVPSELRVQITGHELDDEHHSTYSRDFTAAEKLTGVGNSPGLSVLAYGLDLDALRPLLTDAVSRRQARTPGRKPSAAATARKRSATSGDR
ncbi:TPA: DUF6538 domain-containing protein [Stenotrophomonas maltophilia]